MASDLLPRGRGGDALAYGALLDVLDGVRHVDDALDVDAGRDDVVGLEFAGAHKVLDLGHRHLAGGRHHRIEVARGLAVHEVAFVVAHPGVYDRQVGDDAALHNVALAVEVALFFALGDVGAGAGAGEEGGDARAAGADALGQRALRVELDLQFAGEILLGEQLVLAHVRGDHLLDLLALEQQPETGAIDAGIVRHHGQVLDPGIADRLDQRLGDTAKAEAPAADQHAVLEHAGERRLGVGINFLHAAIPPRSQKATRRARLRALSRKNISAARMQAYFGGAAAGGVTSVTGLAGLTGATGADDGGGAEGAATGVPASRVGSGRPCG